MFSLPVVELVGEANTASSVKSCPNPLHWASSSKSAYFVTRSLSSQRSSNFWTRCSNEPNAGGCSTASGNLFPYIYDNVHYNICKILISQRTTLAWTAGFPPLGYIFDLARQPFIQNVVVMPDSVLLIPRQLDSWGAHCFKSLLDEGHIRHVLIKYRSQQSDLFNV